MPTHADDLAQSILREQESLQGSRGNWESVWEQIARRIFPNYAQQFSGQNRSNPIGGQQNTEEMIDATGAGALIRFAAAMESMLTPRNSIWHGLAPSDRTLRRNRSVRLWFEELTEALFEYRYAPRANYASQKHEEYMGLGAFGTGCMFIDPLKHAYEKGIRYRGIHLGQIYFKENHQGIIDTTYRRYSFTARQAVQKFGAENLPKAIVEDAKNPQKSENPHWFVHCVKPREEFDPKRADVKGMLYHSAYVSVTEKKLLSDSGFHTFPYTISRYVTAPNETYGRAPAMMALPSLKTLNEQKKTVLKQGQRIVDPVLLAHDDGVLDSVSLRSGTLVPGGVNADGRPLIQPLVVGDLAVGQDMMDAEREVINDFFLVTLFQILVDTPQMTATEVIERAREKGAMLAPTMGRQQSESLGPQIEREIDVLMQQGLISPMPEILREARGQYTVQYNSPLSRMAKAEESSGLMRTVDWLKEVVAVTQNPEPFDWINFDESVPDMLSQQAVPLRWQNSPGAVKAKRQGRAQQQQTQQMIEAAPAAASAMKTVTGMVSK